MKSFNEYFKGKIDIYFDEAIINEEIYNKLRAEFISQGISMAASTVALSGLEFPYAIRDALQLEINELKNKL